ncbi:hypothetical protein CHUAL_011399 [Chamberlinius hualienensis]
MEVHWRSNRDETLFSLSSWLRQLKDNEEVVMWKNHLPLFSPSLLLTDNKMKVNVSFNVTSTEDKRENEGAERDLHRRIDNIRNWHGKIFYGHVYVLNTKFYVSLLVQMANYFLCD